MIARRHRRVRYNDDDPRNALQAALRGQYFAPVPATMETGATPGSREKVAVLADRMERGEELWHEADLCWREPMHERIRLPAQSALYTNDWDQYEE